MCTGTAESLTLVTSGAGQHARFPRWKLVGHRINNSLLLRSFEPSEGQGTSQVATGKVGEVARDGRKLAFAKLVTRPDAPANRSSEARRHRRSFGAGRMKMIKSSA